MKAAGHELKGLMAIYQCQIKKLHVPLSKYFPAKILWHNLKKNIKSIFNMMKKSEIKFKNSENFLKIVFGGISCGICNVGNEKLFWIFIWSGVILM